MDGKIERRTYSNLEVRVLREDGELPKIVGYGVPFDSPSVDLPYEERIHKGAFVKTLQERDVKSLMNHDPNRVLGGTKNGTLVLREDDLGLYMEVTPPDTTYANDLLVSIERGDIDGQSFAFKAIRDKWTGYKKRDIYEVDLREVGPVTFPIYPETSAQVRALQEAGIDYEELDQMFTRLQRGLELSDSDRDRIDATIETLRSYLPSAPDPAVHPDDGDDTPSSIAHLSLLHRRLEIAQRQ